MKDVSAVVFAAGRGTRLRPITDGIPKALLPLLDVPLIDHALSHVAAIAGWVIVNVSHLGQPLRMHLVGTGVEVSDEGKEPLGTGATLRGLLPKLADTVIVYNCDLVSDIDMPAMLAAHLDSRVEATLAVRPVDAGADFEASGRRSRFIDRRVESTAGYLYLGAACFSRDLLDELIEDTVPLSLGTAVLQPAVDKGRAAFHLHPGVAIDVGTPAAFLKTSIDALERPRLLRRAVPGTIDPTARVYRGPGAVHEGDAGPGSIILAEASVPAGTRTERCIVMPREVVPAGQLIKDAIFFRGEAIPAG